MEIYIYIYTFKILIFFTLEHTEVRYGPIFIGYSPTGLRVSNIPNRTMRLKTILHGGTSDMTIANFYHYLRELHIILESKPYCLFYFNCRHVTIRILNKLECQDMTGKVIRNTFENNLFRFKLCPKTGPFF